MDPDTVYVIGVFVQKTLTIVLFDCSSHMVHERNFSVMKCNKAFNSPIDYILSTIRFSMINCLFCTALVLESLK